jgi:hypothetical protein
MSWFDLNLDKTRLATKQTYCLFTVKVKLMKFSCVFMPPCSVIPSSSVSVHYLSNSCSHLTQIWHIWIYHEKIQVKFRIWSWSNDFWQSYALWLNFQFPFIISPTVLHIQLKFDIWILQRDVLVKIEFGHGLMIFGRVMPLSLWNNMKFWVSFIISPTVVHILLKFDIWIWQRNVQVKFEFSHGLMIFGRVMPLSL